MEQKIRRDRNMGDNLKRLRIEHDISQEKLCAEHNDVGVILAVLLRVYSVTSEKREGFIKNRCGR